MDYVWLVILGTGVIVMLYASMRMKRLIRAGWVDVFTHIHGNEEFALQFRSALNDRNIESRMRYTGGAGAPGMGMSGAMEVSVSVRSENADEAREVLNELLDKKHGPVQRRNEE